MAIQRKPPDSFELSDSLGHRLPPFHRELDWLIVASPRKEQIAALPRVQKRFPPSNALWTGPDSPWRDADYLRESLTNSQIPVTNTETGQTLELGAGVSLKVVKSS